MTATPLIDFVVDATTSTPYFCKGMGKTLKKRQKRPGFFEAASPQLSPKTAPAK
jgi:hypothetical protein